MSIRTASRWCVGIVGPLVVMAAIALWQYPTPQAAQQAQKPPIPRSRLLDSPQHWVSFTALNRTTDPTMAQPVIVRFYQGVDGSTRQDSGPNLSNPDVISINNIERKLHYTRFKGVWTSYPMFPRADYATRPPMMAGGPGGVNVQAEPAQIQGFTVHRMEKSGKWQHENGDVKDGTVTTYWAPLLNLLPIRMTSTLGGVVEYYDIQVVPQPMSLFAPPPGAVVIEDSEPRGIIDSDAAFAAGFDMRAFIEKHNEKAHKGQHK